MNPKTASLVLFVWIFGFCLMVSLPLHAQVAGATLSGTVMDQSGGVVPQAAISIKNIATGITRSSTTSAAGFYSAPNLLPGTYEIRAAAQGFSSQVQTGVRLTVGEQQVLNFTLQVGQISQTVEVTTEAPTVQLASSAISAVVSATTVVELPLNGRSWTDLATLQPGVNALAILQPTFEVGTDRGNRGFGAQLSISGARPQENNYRLDGVSINDYGNGGPGSVLGGNLGVDSIQEFSVLISLIMPVISRNRLSGTTNLAPRGVGRSAKTGLSSSVISKGCGDPRAERLPTLCHLPMHGWESSAPTRARSSIQPPHARRRQTGPQRTT